VHVLAVGGHHVVVGPLRVDGADGHGLLPDVQVAEAADLAQGVRLGRLFLEAARQQHVVHHLAQLVGLQPLQPLLVGELRLVLGLRLAVQLAARVRRRFRRPVLGLRHGGHAVLRLFVCHHSSLYRCPLRVRSGQAECASAARTSS
jgi:hypothetical protein